MMKLVCLPETSAGRWSLGLSIAFIVLIWAKMQYSIPLPTFAIASIGLAGFIISLVAIFRHKDRSVLNLLPVLVGLLILLWIASELLFPH